MRTMVAIFDAGVTYSPAATGRSRDVAGKRRADDGVVDRLLGARDLGAGLRHGGAGARILGGQPLEVASRVKPFSKSSPLRLASVFAFTRVCLRSFERRARLIQPEARIAVVE